jgi:hypothetical protein
MTFLDASGDLLPAYHVIPLLTFLKVNQLIGDDAAVSLTNIQRYRMPVTLDCREGILDI